jgi:hypothetical protein
MLTSTLPPPPPPFVTGPEVGCDVPDAVDCEVELILGRAVKEAVLL